MNPIICLLLPKPLPLTERVEENTIWAPDPFNVALRDIASLLTVLSCLVTVSFDPTWKIVGADDNF